MTPIQVSNSGGIDLGVSGDLRLLSCPYDNTDTGRYRSYSIDSSDSGYNVMALFDDTDRDGLVLGSVTHSDWKVGTDFSGSSGEGDFLRVYGGATVVQDVMPHGMVTGDDIVSPKVFVGFYDDWREGMNSFADACLAEKPALPLPAGDRAGLLMGWKTGGPSFSLPAGALGPK